MGPLNANLVFRNPTDRAALQRASSLEGESVSDFVRARVLPEAREIVSRELVSGPDPARLRTVGGKS